MIGFEMQTYPQYSGNGSGLSSAHTLQMQQIVRE